MCFLMHNPLVKKIGLRQSSYNTVFSQYDTSNRLEIGQAIIQAPRKECVTEMYFLISQAKHMLWVLKRTVSVKRFFLAPKNNVKRDG